MEFRRALSGARGRVFAAVAAACVLAGAQPASAGPLDLLGGGQEPEQSGSTSAGALPPTGGVTIEAESLDGGSVIVSDGAHGGAFLRTLSSAAVPAVNPGFHEVTVRAKGAGGRLRMTIDGETVAAHTLRKTWTTVHALVRTGESPIQVGLEAEVLPWRGSPAAVDVDWLHFADHESVFTTSGNRIVDLAGAAVTPRGVTFPGYQAASNVGGRLELPPSMAGEKYAWGITLVRIPLNQEHWLANCPSRKAGVDLGYRAAVADEVDRLTARGMMTLLTLTRTERGQATGCAPAGLPVFKEMADTRSPAFWRSVASTFAGNPLVAFDLFNEPHSISDVVWHRGGTVTYQDTSGLLATEASYQAVGMQTLYNAVRSVGADNLVFVSGSRWAADPRAALRQPLSGHGIVLAAHTYCHDCPTPELNRDLDVVVSDEVLSRYPLVITETGWVNPWSGRYNRTFLDWAEERGLGWSIYAWGHPDSNYSLLASWVPASFDAGDGVTTFRPSWAGAPVWNELADVRVERGFDAQPLPEN